MGRQPRTQKTSRSTPGTSPRTGQKKGRPKRRNPSHTTSSWWAGKLGLMLLALTISFVASVLWYVRPKTKVAPETESLTELRDQFRRKESQLRAELEDQLSEWELKNEKIRLEIERLRSSLISPAAATD